MSDDDVGRRIDEALVDMLWDDLKSTYGTRRRDKRSSPLMQVVAMVLARLNVMPKERFLGRFATTVGRTIYLPEREHGVRNLLWEAAVCVHEHVHVRAWSWRFMWRYLTQPMWRAMYEAQAYRTNIALRYWYTGEWLDIKDLAAKIGTNYMCGNGGVELAYRVFDNERNELLQGHITCPVVQQALTFVRQHGVLPARVWSGTDL
jgi:hypothetical protein